MSTVRLFEAKRYDERDFTFGLASGRGAGAFMIVELGHAEETRDAKAGATGGVKNVRYATTLHVFHKAWMEHSEDAGDDLSQLIQAFLDLIHADRTLGGAVWQAGESARGIQVMRPPPTLDGEKTQTAVQISFDADVKIIA